MIINYNIKGNGACPMCRKNVCMIKMNISESVRELSDPSGSGIDVVVYSCPAFEEK